jgi:3-isopropylmalate dehydrogenase
MPYTIAVLPGDGIGPEVVAEGVKVLRAVGERAGRDFELLWGVVGGAAIDQHGTALPPETYALCERADAILVGACGGPKWDDPRAEVRPEQALFALRKGFDLFANLRPVRVFPALVGVSPLKAQVIEGVDLLIVRELTGGLYFGRPSRRWEEEGERRAIDTLPYSEHEICRVLQVAIRLARTRRRKVTSVDKANVLWTSRLWREIATEMAAANPDVQVEHVLVDAMAMHLLRRPRDFDVIVTENMFGDILSDEASLLAGSLGMLPSASINEGPKGLYEPVHGTAPDIAGQQKANPLGTILSVAMLLRFSLGLAAEADAVELAVERVLSAGYRTADIYEEGAVLVSTEQMGTLVAEAVRRGTQGR